MTPNPFSHRCNITGDSDDFDSYAAHVCPAAVAAVTLRAADCKDFAQSILATGTKCNSDQNYVVAPFASMGDQSLPVAHSDVPCNAAPHSEGVSGACDDKSRGHAELCDQCSDDASVNSEALSSSCDIHVVSKAAAASSRVILSDACSVNVPAEGWSSSYNDSLYDVMMVSKPAAVSSSAKHSDQCSVDDSLKAESWGSPFDVLMVSKPTSEGSSSN